MEKEREVIEKKEKKEKKEFTMKAEKSNCRFYENDLPVVGEVLVVRVIDIGDYRGKRGAYFLVCMYLSHNFLFVFSSLNSGGDLVCHCAVTGVCSFRMSY